MKKGYLIATILLVFGCTPRKSTTMNSAQKEIIENYITSYNAFDIDGMTQDMHPNIVFENISNGQVDLRTEGLEEFTKQASAALSYFSTREQSIQSWEFEGDKVLIDIAYKAILAMDFPDGLKTGDTLELKGLSVFEFEGEKIIKIQDKS